MTASPTDSEHAVDLQAQLMRAEVQMEAVLAAIPDAVVTVDESQTIRAFNPGAEMIFGYAASEVIGKSLDMLIPEESVARHRHHVRDFPEAPEAIGRMDARRVVAGRRKDGTTFPAESAMLRTGQRDGQMLMTAILRDVSVQRSTDELYRTLVDQSNDGIVILQGEEVAFASPAALELIGYAPGERINWVNLISPEEREAVVANNRRRVEGEAVTAQYGVTLIRKDGRRVVAEIKPKAIEYEGRPSVLTFLRDVTERTEMERAARERGERLSMLFNESVDAVLVVKPETRDEPSRIIDLNSRAVEMFGYSSGRLRSMTYGDLLAPGDLERLPLQFKELETGEVVQAQRRMVRRDGVTLDVDTRGRQLRDGNVLISLRDITQQIRAEQALRARDERLRILFEESEDPIIVVPVGMPSRIVDFNQAAMRFLGYGADELQQIGYGGLLDPQELEDIPFHDLEPGQSMTRQRRVHKRDGSTAIMETRAKRMSDEQSGLMMIVLRDISERVAGDQALRLREAELRQAQNLARMGTWTLDVKKDRMTFSRELVALLDLPCAEFGRMEWVDLIHPEDSGQLQAWFTEALKDKLSYETDYRLVKPDGSIVTAHAWNTVEVGLDGTATFLHGVVQDVTAQRALEQTLRERDEQLQQSQRLESLGLLAGGIAHDFNNLLAAIMGNAAYLRMSLGDDDESREVAVEIERETVRGAELIHQLLAFARSQELEPQVVDVEMALHGFLKMARAIVGAPVEIRTDVAENPWPVFIDPTKLDQVLMNLVVNARDAMPDGGTLTIGLRNAAAHDGTVRQAALDAGDYVMLTVADAGVGMDAETMARIFDRFYTTKPASRGTGLGLSTVHGIVSQSGGKISVESEPGRGTTFTVILPKAVGLAD